MCLVTRKTLTGAETNVKFLTKYVGFNSFIAKHRIFPIFTQKDLQAQYLCCIISSLRGQLAMFRSSTLSRLTQPGILMV